MNYSQLIKQLNKGTADPVYLILGDQEYLSQQIKEAFIRLIPDSERSMNIGNYDMEDTTISTAVEDAISVPFFGERRLVIVNRPFFLTGMRVKSKLEQNTDDFLDYLQHPEESTVMVIFAPYDKLDSRKKVTKALKKVATTIEIGNLRESEIKKLVTDKISDQGFSINSDALDRMVELTGGKLTSMMSDLPKLILYNNETKIIDVESVNGLVSRSMEQNVFDLVNSVLRKDPKQSMDIYHQLLLENDEPIRINAVLIQQFRLLLQVMILQKHGYAQGNLASTLKVHPYRIKLAIQTVKHFSYNQLRDAYIGLVDTERQMKSTSRPPELLFELFVLKFMKQVS
ncbi:DNA polymerase III subunit delta [Lentilactobacillus parabuchneri]|jgi:DNA polymerase-3 subunit delta|uniref:DNA polymerase III subunit delta n=3 Tax=Lentilactobacillus parabuchneri TaxID=152331 RepID=A0A1X1FHT4_9LACO|nr:DNA polymerase III subunit delta [Lentilactobacillus parabuchneri]APR06413.1 DNA polymerase III subunit delta [Lentilactobacillus parabuchneri]KRM46336.1 DNA polymerase III subunit delta [Lentilactobacillus parabuchneri DSM 5707 = NBRC 107865]KRN79764.1 DNA polymerase III subunit delta [Lentilactobacillus parabuchneri]MBW0223246.1 DNA polymerase III subunit delta [Lentilactobacillus parabuchneri]MBW0246309.1 DNA polymerase III subunit delta [Lentilactobacillus parabuchneri]